MVLVAAAACGGAARSDSTAPFETGRPNQQHAMGHTGTGENGPKDQKGEMGRMEKTGDMGEMDMPPEVKKFHDALAPRWHAEHGPRRMADTCAAIPELQGDAEALVAARPPSGARPDDWAASGRRLGDAVAALDATCKASDATAFEPAFMAVHDRFHAVMAAAGAHHEDHGDHSGHEKAEHDHGEH
jgi:hypothetical protein